MLQQRVYSNEGAGQVQRHSYLGRPEEPGMPPVTSASDQPADAAGPRLERPPAAKEGTCVRVCACGDARAPPAQLHGRCQRSCPRPDGGRGPRGPLGRTQIWFRRQAVVRRALSSLRCSLSLSSGRVLNKQHGSGCQKPHFVFLSPVHVGLSQSKGIPWLRGLPTARGGQRCPRVSCRPPILANPSLHQPHTRHTERLWNGAQGASPPPQATLLSPRASLQGNNKLSFCNLLIAAASRGCTVFGVQRFLPPSISEKRLHSGEEHHSITRTEERSCSHARGTVAPAHVEALGVGRGSTATSSCFSPSENSPFCNMLPMMPLAH